MDLCGSHCGYWEQGEQQRKRRMCEGEVKRREKGGLAIFTSCHSLHYQGCGWLLARLCESQLQRLSQGRSWRLMLGLNVDCDQPFSLV